MAVAFCDLDDFKEMHDRYGHAAGRLRDPFGDGAQYLVPRLIGWYSRHGFKSTGGQDLRLYMKVATARKHLEQE